MILKVVLYFCFYVFGCQCCIMLLNQEWIPMSIERKAELAQIVVSARTLSTFLKPRYQYLYSANFEVLSILKGWEILHRLKRQNSKVVTTNERLIITVGGFGDRRRCFSSVNVGETHILFLGYNNITGGLVAKHDDIFGATERLDEETENDILLSLGWKPWTHWSDCNQKCGSGLGFRQRKCIDKYRCSGPSEEIRECNMFPCQDAYDILQLTKNFHEESGANSAIINKVHDSAVQSSIPSVPTYLAFPDKFPSAFSLFITIRATDVKKFGYIFSSYDANNRMQFGLRLEENCLSFVYTNPKSLFSEKFVKSFHFEMRRQIWYEIAVSLEKTRLKMVVNCNQLGETRIEWPITEHFDIFGFMYVGADKIEGRASKFEHQISQLMFTGDPGMLWKQCGTRSFFYPGYLGKSRQQAPVPSTDPRFPVIKDDSESGDVDENFVASGNGSQFGESDVSEAARCSEECKNGGVCKDGVCKCSTGWSGVDCSQPLCKKSCKNDGICVKPDICQCKNGTMGQHCENFVCNPGCRNGGVCVGKNTCKCPSQMKGKYCEKDTCASVRCLNGGKCVFGRCVCPSAYHGRWCEKRVCLVYGTRKVSYLKPVVAATLRHYKYQCGLLKLRTCSRTKMEYKMVNKIDYRDEYYCKG